MRKVNGMRLQTLIATMNRQHDYRFLDAMNLEGEVIVINQCDEINVEYKTGETYSATVISSKKRGISNSRNEAILHTDADVFLTGDDDIVYRKGYGQIVLDCFERHPEADIIAFNTGKHHVPEGMPIRQDYKKWRKAPPNRYYESVSLAYRKSSFDRKNLHFHPLFGTGSVYLNGEESLVQRAARQQGLRIYESPEVLADVDYSESTWFKGFDAKYFYDKGALVKCAYPYTYRLMKYYFLLKKKGSDLSFKEILHQINLGIRSLH